VLVFAPNHPAATVAASDIVKAILFRSLKVLFGPGSKLFEKPELGRHHALIHELLGRAEDVYDESIPNLDAFLTALEEGIGRHPILGAIAANLEGFHVHYVLNMFNGVEESHRDAVTPFVRNLTEHVSSRLHLSQLGWIVHDDRIHESNRTGYPILLNRQNAETPPIDPVLAELQAIESSALGFRRPGKERSAVRRSGSFRLPSNPGTISSTVVETEDLLQAELEALGTMYTSRKGDTVHENFAYLVHRALGQMAPPMAKSDFGQTSLAPIEELTDWFLRWQRAFGG
jgi:hypothetical protein